MSSLGSTRTRILVEGQNLHLSGNSIQTKTFSWERTLEDGGKIKFKLCYSADLDSFGMLEIYLVNTKTRTGNTIISIPGGSVQSEERERELQLQEAENYYFLFKMTAGFGTFDIENYQLYWSAS